jgi:hypothetical protein
MRAKLQGGLNKAGSTRLGKALFIDSAAQMHARGTQAMEEKSKAYVEAKIAGTGKQKAELAKMIGGPQGRLAMAQALADGEGGKYSMEEIVALHEGLKKDKKEKEAQAVLSARGLNEGAINAYVAGDRNQFMTETAKAISMMSPDEYARFMKNDGKAITEGKYFADKKGNSVLNEKFGAGTMGAYRDQMYQLAYEDSAKTRATAAQIAKSSDREEFFMGGAAVKLGEYDKTVDKHGEELKALEKEIKEKETAYDKEQTVALKKELEILVERKANLDKQFVEEKKEAEDLHALHRGQDNKSDIVGRAQAMRKSKNPQIKAFGDSMKLM